MFVYIFAFGSSSDIRRVAQMRTFESTGSLMVLSYN
jgi:hypothetical protein